MILTIEICVIIWYNIIYDVLKHIADAHNIMEYSVIFFKQGDIVCGLKKV